MLKNIKVSKDHSTNNVWIVQSVFVIPGTLVLAVSYAKLTLKRLFTQAIFMRFWLQYFAVIFSVICDYQHKLPVILTVVSLVCCRVCATST